MLLRGSWPRLLLLAVGIWLGASARAVGQCMPDGLNDGPCCTMGEVRLPAFPAVHLPIKYICFDSCDPRINRDACVDIAAPVATPNCGVYTISFTIRACGPQMRVLWTGTLTAQYSRNWLEAGPANATLGVWRFVLNGDLVPSTFVVNRYGQNRCAVAPCFFTYGRFFVFGHIDYALNCQTGVWQAAGSLDHECDPVTHAPFTGRPIAGGSHPTLSYTWVWPATGFVVSAAAGPRSEGPIIQEAIRFNDWSTAPAICRCEEPIQGGIFQPIREFCLCGSTTSPLQYIETNVQGGGICGTTFFFGPTPNVPLPFLQKRIGGWTIPAAFPGTEFLLLDLGAARYTNGCTGVTTNQYFEGVETLGGYPARSYLGVPLGFQFEDLVSSNTQAGATVVSVPHLSYFILNLNLP